MALPFLRNSLIGDLAFSACLFGALALGEARIATLRTTAVGSIGSRGPARA
jgi:hypothetical protein